MNQTRHAVTALTMHKRRPSRIHESLYFCFSKIAAVVNAVTSGNVRYGKRVPKRCIAEAQSVYSIRYAIELTAIPPRAAVAPAQQQICMRAAGLSFSSLETPAHRLTETAQNTAMQYKIEILAESISRWPSGREL